MSIYFLRHAKVYNNVNNILNGGETNSELSVEGIKEFDNKNFQNTLKNIQIDLIYISSLKRSLQTGYKVREILNFENEILVDKRLNEQYYGEFHGYSVEYISNLYNVDIKNISKIYRNENKCGESWDGFVSRVRYFFDSIKELKKNILLVAHGGTYRALNAIINNLSFEESIRSDYSIKNLELKELI